MKTARAKSQMIARKNLFVPAIIIPSGLVASAMTYQIITSDTRRGIVVATIAGVAMMAFAIWALLVWILKCRGYIRGKGTILIVHPIMIGIRARRMDLAKGDISLHITDAQDEQLKRLPRRSQPGIPLIFEIRSGDDSIAVYSQMVATNRDLTDRFDAWKAQALKTERRRLKS